MITKAQSITGSLFDYISYSGSILAYLVNYISQKSPRYCWKIPIWVLCGLGSPLVILCFFVRDGPKQHTPLIMSIKKLLERRTRPKLTITIVSTWGAEPTTRYEHLDVFRTLTYRVFVRKLFSFESIFCSTLACGDLGNMWSACTWVNPSISHPQDIAYCSICGYANFSGNSLHPILF